MDKYKVLLVDDEEEAIEADQTQTGMGNAWI